MLPFLASLVLLYFAFLTWHFKRSYREAMKRQVMTGVTLVFLSLSVVVPWIGFSTTLIDHDVTIVLGLVAFLIGLVVAAVRGQPLRITRFIDDRLHLRGTGLAFRESFDEFDEQGLPRFPSMSR